jgi:DNA-binding GntR family transcriptional regulator
LDCDHGLRRQAIVGSILSDIFQGRMRAGQHLVTQELADRFGVSHTPIREALIALGAMGIIDLLPNRGAIVRRVSARDVREVCQVRRLLECQAVRSACGRIEITELQSVAADLRKQMRIEPPLRGRAIESARSLDSKLHDLISGSCGNAFLARELSRLKILFRAFRDVAWEHDQSKNEFHRLTEESREHLAIVEALIAGQPVEASRAMSDHIRAGARYWSRALCPPKPGTNGKPHTNSSPARARRQEPPR